MTNLHMIKTQRAETSMIKQTLMYALFLVVCVWMLYQIHHSIYVTSDSDCDDFSEKKLIDERMAKLLGRKGGVGKSHYHTEEMELYGVDLIGEALRMNNNAIDVDETDVDKKGNDSTGGGPNMLIPENRGIVIGSRESEMETMVKVKAVILKTGEKMKILKVSDVNGVPVHESGPSRRSDVEIKTVRKGGTSKCGNRTKELKGCKKVYSQNATGMEIVKSRKGSMRDLLLIEIKGNSDGFTG